MFLWIRHLTKHDYIEMKAKKIRSMPVWKQGWVIFFIHYVCVCVQKWEVGEAETAKSSCIQMSMVYSVNQNDSDTDETYSRN